MSESLRELILNIYPYLTYHLSLKTYDIVSSIVTYNSPAHQVRDAVRTFLDTKLKVKLILVDNSQDEAIKLLAEEFKLEYIDVGSNIGFGHGHNLAIDKYANQSSYFLILNPDVVVLNGCLEKLVRFMEAHPEVPLCAPKILNFDHTTQYVHRRLPNFWMLIGRRFLPEEWKQKFQAKFDHYELRDFDFTKPIMTPCLSGCFMFFRSTALIKLGGFDRRYFLYMEDYDLSREASNLGPTVIVPEATILHGWVRASYRSLKYLRMNIVSTLKYFMKWGPNDQCRAQLFNSGKANQ